MTCIKNRKEIVFLYDVTYNNPNGDPNDENKPRMDVEVKRCLVTDSRLKRTIRDFLMMVLGEVIFVYSELIPNKEYKENGSAEEEATPAPVEEQSNGNGKGKGKGKGKAKAKAKVPKMVMITKEGRMLDLSIKCAEDLVKNCIDARMFGAVNAVENNTIKLTGPVQFNMGTSLHAVEVAYMQGTTIFPSASGQPAERR